jgi:hypothetical protein
MCRLALRARRVSGREQHLLLQSFRPPESSTELELELQLQLQRWLPAVKQVLIDCVLDPAAYDIEGADTRFRRPGLEQLYLTKYNLLGDDVASEMRCLFMAKLGDPGVSGTHRTHDTHTTHTTHYTTRHTLSHTMQHATDKTWVVDRMYSGSGRG